MPNRPENVTQAMGNKPGLEWLYEALGIVPEVVNGNRTHVPTLMNDRGENDFISQSSTNRARQFPGRVPTNADVGPYTQDDPLYLRIAQQLDPQQVAAIDAMKPVQFAEFMDSMKHIEDFEDGDLMHEVREWLPPDLAYDAQDDATDLREIYGYDPRRPAPPLPQPRPKR